MAAALAEMMPKLAPPCKAVAEMMPKLAPPCKAVAEMMPKLAPPFISRFCHILSASLNSHFWKGCNRKPFKYFHICGFYFRDHNTLVKIKPTRK
jgi:hypothetical protein